MGPTLIWRAMGWLALFASSASGMDHVTTLSEVLSCDYYEGRKESDHPEQEPSPDFLKLLQDITSTVGLKVDYFVLRAGDVYSAKALIRGSDRKIVYNPAFMARLKEATNEEWAARSVLAHEVGHHLKDHLLAPLPRPESELEADRFAGRAVCQLGGTWLQAESALSQFGERRQPEGYPELNVRLEAVNNGWSLALGRGCPWSARLQEPMAERLTKLRNSEVVTQENASNLLGRPFLAAATIHFENVQWKIEHPLILYAERISFGASSVLKGRDLTLIAREIEGGRIDVSGGEGEDGGRMLVAASVVRNTVMIARGGDGAPGKDGERGKNGVHGRDGIDGDCGPAGHASGEAGYGTDGKPGDHGGAGGRSGSGGEIALLVFRRDQAETDVEPESPEPVDEVDEVDEAAPVVAAAEAVWERAARSRNGPTGWTAGMVPMG